MFEQKREIKQERLTHNDIDVLLQAFREISQVIHHQIGGEIKWQLFKAAIVQVMKDHPQKREALKQFFGDIERDKPSNNACWIYEEIIAIRNFPHPKNRFNKIFMKDYKGSTRDFAKDVYANTKKFRRFIGRHRNKAPGLFNLLIQPER